MARAGAFRELDAAIAFHPATVNAVTLGHSLGLNSAKFNFRGRTALPRRIRIMVAVP
jgi:aminobenzoyl-glutamate utilization protein B